MNQLLKKQLKTAIVVLSIIVLAGWYISKSDTAQNINAIQVTNLRMECLDNHSTVSFNLVNTSDHRVDKTRVVVTITEKRTGKTYDFESVYRSGILANETLTKSLNIARFDCNAVDVSATAYPF
ncbi:MAG: hypothetical protein ACK5JD_11055 [Mangrovibacterium sp.]